MNRLLTVPSPHEDAWVVNLADWVELKAWFSDDGNASREDLRRALNRDGGLSDGHGTGADFRMDEKLNHVFKELKDRQLACGKFSDGGFRYPFSISNDGSLLSVRSNKIARANLVYLFLLAVTKSDMSSARSKVPHDPTKVFERLCRDVIESFWGGPSDTSGALIIGTSVSGTAGQAKFRAKIDELCGKLGEGLGFRQGARAPGGGDGSLDLVAWRKFTDGRQGGLVGFGQCKTGVHWDEHLTQLAPEAFNRDFMVRGLVLAPLRIYLVPCRISDHRWESHTGKAGLLLDRCRLVEYSTDLSTQVAADCKSWLKGMFAELSNKPKQTVTS